MPRGDGFSAVAAGREATSPAHYACSECGLDYPVVDNVLDFLPQDTRKKGRGQKLMESERIVQIYEGKWWRACKLFALLMGISLDEEIALIKSITDPGPGGKSRYQRAVTICHAAFVFLNPRPTPGRPRNPVTLM